MTIFVYNIKKRKIERRKKERETRKKGNDILLKMWRNEYSHYL